MSDSLDLYKDEHNDEHREMDSRMARLEEFAKTVKRCSMLFATVGVVQLGMLIYWVGSANERIRMQGVDMSELKMEVRELAGRIQRVESKLDKIEVKVDKQ